jgi:hypothetical protein
LESNRSSSGGWRIAALWFEPQVVHVDWYVAATKKLFRGKLVWELTYVERCRARA